ncbi:MAG: o-succinylbenzoate synthase [Cyanobacteriota bacterium]|nr:o-succinylbenzoate synthase [Cyanobacteriota bacterium]
MELKARAGGSLSLQWRRFRLELPGPLISAAGRLREKRGWLLRLEDSRGALGWGEAAPLDGELAPMTAAIQGLGSSQARPRLEQALAAGTLPGCLAFALGSALAELDGLPPRRWLPAPPSARLLPAGAAALGALAGSAPAWKWKVAVHADAEERAVLEQLLQLLPADARLRLDANGGWDRATAWSWAERLAAEPRLQWLEQPLPPRDHAGLAALAAQVPVALDESLQIQPASADAWPGWQVRRPSQQGDPRPLLEALEAGRPWLMLSTAFETGIGRRWLEHLAALQAEGPTPAPPGLAPGWQPAGLLASSDPLQVWEAAG